VEVRETILTGLAVEKTCRLVQIFGTKDRHNTGGTKTSRCLLESPPRKGTKQRGAGILCGHCTNPEQVKPQKPNPPRRVGTGGGSNEER